MSDMTPGPASPLGRARIRGGRMGWGFGVVLILIGLVLFLERTGVIAEVGNWWGFLIYLAAIANLVSAWRAYKGDEPGRSVGVGLTWGLVLAVVATIVLFGLDTEVWGPLVLVAAGVGIVGGQLLRRSSD